jgi:hypothetical protein
MAGTIIFLGAGATKACGGPLTNEILPKILAQTPVSISGPDQRLNLLTGFLQEQFHVDAMTAPELFPGLPLLMSLLDTALERRQTFDSQWDFYQVSELRQAMELGIFDLLEKVLIQAPTNNHREMLMKIYPAGTEPCVISTNYDLIVDTAMMSISELRTGDGKFPDYGCELTTEFYRLEHPHFGTLLKLHGSLNWLYCKTCHRLEIGASESRRYLRVMTKLFGRPTLEQSYTADGAPCPTCTTKLRPLLVAPTHLKDYRNPHLTQVWYEAERVLREAERVIFVGYSLPEDDVEVIYLLKRSLAHLSSDRITVVEFDSAPIPSTLRDNAVGRRYRALFGDGLDWHPEGMDTWLAQVAAAF